MEPRPRGRPRGEPSSVQRRRVVGAARVEFTEHGYEGAKVSVIAEAARVSRAVVYETVGDKAALLAAVADEISAEVVGALDLRFSRRDAVERSLADLVREDLTWFMHLVRSDPSISAIARLSKALGLASDQADRTRRLIEDRLTRLHEDRARELGVERGASARLVAMLVVALAETMAFRPDPDDAWPISEAAAVVVEFAIGGYQQIEGRGRAVADEFDREVAAREAGQAGPSAPD